jgi:hypothetical protein
MFLNKIFHVMLMFFLFNLIQQCFVKFDHVLIVEFVSIRFDRFCKCFECLIWSNQILLTQLIRSRQNLFISNFVNKNFHEFIKTNLCVLKIESSSMNDSNDFLWFVNNVKLLGHVKLYYLSNYIIYQT